jgi:predicted O-methyltransferase YrrM
MILLITCVAKAQECARALQEAANEPIVVCSALQEAVRQLQEKEFSAVVFDLLLLDAQPDEGESVFKHLESAVPVYSNFAITGTARVARELRSALQRRKREVQAAKNDAEQALHHELKDALTALLLSCEMALQVPELPSQAATRMQAVEALAKEVSAKLGRAI